MLQITATATTGITATTGTTDTTATYSFHIQMLQVLQLLQPYYSYYRYFSPATATTVYYVLRGTICVLRYSMSPHTLITYRAECKPAVCHARWLTFDFRI